MSASFRLALDTVARVAASINGGKESTERSVVSFEVDFEADTEAIKVWGDIDPDDPTNAAFGQTESAAPWIEPTAKMLVALEEGNGRRRLNVAVRDDVWNEGSATATIFVGEVTPPPVPIAPAPGGGRPERLPRPAPTTAHRVTSASSIGFTTSAAVAVVGSGSAAIGAATSSAAVVGAPARSGLGVTASSAAAVKVTHGSMDPWTAGVEDFEIRKRPGDDLIAALLL